MKSPLARFILLVLAWLPVTFGVWYVLAPIILWPVQLFTAVIGNLGLRDLVVGVDARGATLTFVTTLKPGSVEAGGVLSVDVNMLLYAFGLPLFAALTLAAHEPGWWRRLLIGYFAMLPFILWGVVADFLKNIAVTASPLVTSQTGFSALDRDIIVFAFQFGSLILPAVVPAIAWVLTHRAFLEGLRGPRSGVNGA
ncbi:MAG: hypothetical protein IT521_00450 [Burkholderiales bacterium]|nr:hypothetical protein [Burkholderiales bacterium]